MNDYVPVPAVARDEAMSCPRRHQPESCPTLEVAALFEGHREIRLRYSGVEYRLQRTRNGKLILTK